MVLIGLTPLGVRKAGDVISEGPAVELLGHLKESGPTSLEDLASAMGTTKQKVRSLARKLYKAGLVKKEG